MLRMAAIHFDWLGVWLGHACCIATLAPGILSVCEVTYKVATELRGTKGPLPRAVRDEMRTFASLVFLAVCPLDLKYGPDVYIGDSSTFAWGVVTSPASDQEQRDVG